MNTKPAAPLGDTRILFALCGFDLGGAERQALHLARHLKGLGCDVRVWGHHHHCPGPELVIKHCEAAGIPWSEHRFRWPCGKWALLRDARRLLRALWRERPDVILCYTTWPNVACGLTWRWSPAKVCVWGQRNVDDLQGDSIERLAYRRVSAVICNAAHETTYLRRTLGETPAQVSVVHNGLDLAPPRRTRAEWRMALKIEEDATVVTMVANFRPQKDHPALLRAWKKVMTRIPPGRTRPRLLLAGVRHSTYDDALQLAGDLGLLDTVHFLGQVEDITGLLSSCDIGVLASKHEGLSNAVIEYMASGLPVIATDLPGNREALGEEPDQPYVSRGDSNRLAGLLRVLIDQPEKRRKLGEFNRARARTRFSIEAMCRSTADVLARLLDDTGRGAKLA